MWQEVKTKQQVNVVTRSVPYWLLKTNDISLVANFLLNSKFSQLLATTFKFCFTQSQNFYGQAIYKGHDLQNILVWRKKCPTFYYRIKFDWVDWSAI